MKKLLTLIFLLLIVIQAECQETIDTYTVWGSPGGTLTYNPNGNLIVNDTLIIYGNLYLDNDEDLTISNSGVLIVFGDFDAKNKVDLGLGGYFIVTGDFNKNGGQGDIIDNGGSMFIFDDTPTWGSPPEPPDEYGDEEDIVDDPIFDFFDDLIQTVCDLEISNAVISPDLCNGAPADGAIDITLSGAATPPPALVYSWTDEESNVFSTQDISGLDTGNYTINVYQGFCFAVNTYTVYSMPPAGAISGSDSVCINATATYTISAIPGATSYTWSADNGATGSSSTTSINLTFPNAGPTTLSVFGVNSCGTSDPSTYEVDVSESFPAASKISGTLVTCAGTTGDSYSVTDNAGWTYAWSVEDNVGTILPPGNTAGIAIDWQDNTFIFTGVVTSVIKKVTATVTENYCSTILEWDVTINRLPETGPTYHIPNSQN